NWRGNGGVKSGGKALSNVPIFLSSSVKGAFGSWGKEWISRSCHLSPTYWSGWLHKKAARFFGVSVKTVTAAIAPFGPSHFPGAYSIAAVSMGSLIALGVL